MQCKRLGNVFAILAALLALASCSGGGAGPAGGGEKTYAIGDRGPAGGIVFYDKGDSTGGWRYLEAAPADVGAGFGWGSLSVTGVTATAIGTGKQNTQTLVGLFPTGAISAAKNCQNYSMNGYSDWFLPSKDENVEMLNALAIHGLGGFSSSSGYWSSTEYDYYFAYYSWFNATGVSTGEYDKTDRGLTTRPIRMF